jgi:hypothetical protein
VLQRRRCIGLSVNFLELLADLSKPHGCVGKDLVFRDLLLYDLCKDDLERQRQAGLVDVLFEHQRLVLPLADLVVVGLVGRHELLVVVFVDLVHFIFKKK